MQGSLGVVGFLTFCMIYCWFPETSQPGSRGIDKMRAESGENAKDHFYFINPLRPLLLLRSPNLLLIVSTHSDCTWIFGLVNPYASVGHTLCLFIVIFWYVPPLLYLSYANSFDKVKISPCRSNCVYHRMSISSLPALPKLNAWKGTRYNVANEALVGACFLPAGLGTMCNFIFISGILMQVSV